MPIDHNIVFQGAGGHYLSPEAAESHQVSIAEAAQRGRINKQVEEQNQVLLDQQKRQAAAQKIISDELTEAYRTPPSMTPKQVADQGGAPATDLPTGANGKPTLAGASGAVDEIPQERPSIGEMVGPVDRGSGAVQGEPVSVAEAAGPTPAAPAPAAPQPAAAPPKPAPPQEHPIGWVPRVRDKLIAAGYGPEAIAFESSINKHLDATREATAKRQQEEVKAESARFGLVDNDLRYFIDSVPDAVKSAQWPSFIANQVRKGHLTQQEAGEYQDFPGAQQLPALHSMLVGHKAALDDALKTAQTKKAEAEATEYASPAAAAERQAKSEKAVAEAQEKVREGDSAILSAAASRGKAAYANAYEKLPEPRRAAFPPPEEFKDTTADDVMVAGLSGPGRAAHEDRVARQVAANEQRETSNEFRRVLIGIAQEKAGKESAAEAAERRQDTQIGKELQNREAPLYPIAGQLAAQLKLAKKGNQFFDIDGRGRKHGTTTLDPNTEEGKAAIASMQTAHDDIQDEIKGIIARKNDIVVKYGGTPWVAPAAPPAEKIGPPTPEKTTAPPAKSPIPNFPSALSGQLRVGVPTKIKDSNGNETTVVKQSDGKVYIQ